MNKDNIQRPLFAVEQDVRSGLAALEAAADEEHAALAYNNLKSCIEELIRRSVGLREENFRLRNTVTRQANDISNLALEAAIGEGAPDEAPLRHFTFHEPDVVTVQNSPDFFFIRLSYGLVNIRHIVQLDTSSGILFTTTGTRHLSALDAMRLKAVLRLFPAPETPKGVPAKPEKPSPQGHEHQQGENKNWGK